MIKFEIYLGKDLLWHWRLKAANNEIVCWSEGYTSKQSAATSIKWVKQNAPVAIVVVI